MLKAGLPIKPTYQRLLLARGELSKTPDIYIVRWFPLGRDFTESEWTWFSTHRGLSILTAEPTRGILRDRWANLADRCRTDYDHFDSLRIFQSVESTDTHARAILGRRLANST